MADSPVLSEVEGPVLSVVEGPARTELKVTTGPIRGSRKIHVGPNRVDANHDGVVTPAEQAAARK